MKEIVVIKSAPSLPKTPNTKHPPQVYQNYHMGGVLVSNYQPHFKLKYHSDLTKFVSDLMGKDLQQDS